MVVGMLAAVGHGLALPFMTVVFNDVINTFGKTTDSQIVHQVSKVSLEFVYLGVAAGVASFLQVACWTITSERQAARVRNLHFKTILRQDIAYFDKEATTGEVIEKMSRDIFLIQGAMGEKAGKFIQLASSFLGGFVVAFIKGWKLTLAVLAVVPLVVMSTALMFIIIAKLAAQGQTAYSEATTTVEQTVGSIRTVASFTGEAPAVNKYDKSLNTAYKISVLEGLVGGVGLGVSVAISFFGYALGTWFGASLILNERYTGADVINVMVALVTGSISLGQASTCTSAFAEGQAAAFKLFETIYRKPEIDSYDSTGKILEDIEGEIELKDVCFSYPTRPKELIFTGLSLFIPSGATVALVGESGSGKSTVISLIERFYDPLSGEVLVDQINLKEFQLRWIRGKIGLVSQEPVLFASSIRDNIAYGKDDATLEEIKAAADLANVSNFIDNFPQGLDTIVGEHGTQLSGGQKQRVAIARAILKNPRILLLDEATSALDVESERAVQEALDRVMTSRTTVIVAHRLNTVRHANMIYVIHHGSVVEKGSHTELLEDSNGTYAQLLHFQEGNQGSYEHSQDDQDNTSAIIGPLSSHHSFSKQSSFKSGEHPSFSDSMRLVVEPANQHSAVQQPDTEETPKKHLEVPLWRLAYLNKQELPVLLLGGLAAAVSGTILPVFGALLSFMVQIFYGPPLKLQKDSRFWSLIFVVVGLVTILFFSARAYFFSVAGSKLVRRIRLMSFDKVVHMEIGWFDKSENSSGAIASRLSIDAATVRSLVGDSLALLVENAATLISGLVIAFLACWQLALVVLASVPMMALSGWVQVKFLEGFNANGKMMYEEASQLARDAVGSIRTVASFTAEEKVMELYKKKCEGPRNLTVRQGLISGTGLGFSNFLIFSLDAISFYAGAHFVENGKATFEDVFRAFFVLSMAAMGISQTSSMAPDLSKARSATASVFAILDRTSKIDSGDDSGIILEQVMGNIEFQHVSFRYPTRPDVQVFQDLCLAFQSGKTVALVGESGSGKSTIISLLQRFYDPNSGNILLDGIKIQKLQLRWLRQQMSLVSQEPVLFSDTIRANIAYGKGGEATEAEILAAAQAANAHQFISGLDQGYNAMAGERGVQLSGGQKQRVAIARAIVKEPKILLLDEATSALDTESERAVQDALDLVRRDRTTIIIAHRLSTIRGADLIVVVKNGVIIEKGKHEALINITDGAYASLIALQSNL